jgi:hypothetical protein
MSRCYLFVFSQLKLKWDHQAFLHTRRVGSQMPSGFAERKHGAAESIARVAASNQYALTLCSFKVRLITVNALNLLQSGSNRYGKNSMQ